MFNIEVEKLHTFLSEDTNKERKHQIGIVSFIEDSLLRLGTGSAVVCKKAPFGFTKQTGLLLILILMCNIAAVCRHNAFRKSNENFTFYSE